MLVPDKREPRILIVDDQEPNVRLLEQLMKRSGYSQYFSTRDSRETLPMCQAIDPDILLLDLHMPHLDGYAVLAELQSFLGADTFLPVLVLTADGFPAAKQKALSLGATDFVSKPFDTIEVILRIRNLLRMRFLHLELSDHNRSLGEKVRERTKEVHQAQFEMLSRLATASESRDDDTGEHTKRVGMLAAELGRRTGWPEERLEEIRRAASLHDIGKISIPDRILLKPGRLDPEEFETMKTHAAAGARILSGSRFPLLHLAEEIAHYHHERWDGGGYYSIAGDEIPMAARIVAIADVFDVLTHSRPYKKAWALEDAIALIRKESGSHFDPHLASEFLKMVSSSDLNALSFAIAEEPAPVTASR
jgi:putative two-component system response regulator